MSERCEFRRKLFSTVVATQYIWILAEDKGGEGDAMSQSLAFESEQSLSMGRSAQCVLHFASKLCAAALQLIVSCFVPG